MKRLIYSLLLIGLASTANAQEWSKALEKKAKKGDVEAQVEVADAYFNGYGVKKDLDKAAHWYYEATLHGNETARTSFYSFYSKLLEKYAKSGDTQAQYEVGCDYLEGSGVDRDIKEAAEWFLKAMKQNHEGAKEKFYTFYSKELEKRAKRGDAEAQYRIGVCYMTGADVKRDTETGADWLSEAMIQNHEGAKEKYYSFYSKNLEKRAKKGDMEAQFVVGNSYLLGSDVKRDSETAAEWLLKAMLQGHEGAKEKFYSFYSKELVKRAKKDDALAQFALGDLYFTGGYGLKMDKETAAEWYFEAKAQGHEEAKEKFYSFYSKMLVKAAKDKDAEAQFSLGNFYYEGGIVKKDIETAAEWYLAAKSLEHQGATEKFYSFHSKLLEKTSKKDVEALYRVGCFYLEGKGGVELNEKKGFKFLLKADQEGHPEAFNKFASNYSKDLQKMAKKNPRAKLALAKCYLNGNGIAKSVKTAKSLLEEVKEDSEYGREAQELLDSLEND